MRRAIPWLRALLLSVWTVVGLFACVGMWQARGIGGQVNAVLTGAAKVMQDAQGTLERVNAPCTGFHGSVSCGTLAQIDQTTKNIGIVAGQSALTARQTGELVQATTGTLNSMAGEVSATAKAGRGTLNAAATTMDEATRTLAAVQSKIPDTQRLVDGVTLATADLDKTVRDADGLVTSPDVQRFLKASADTSMQVSGIAADVHKETTKLTAPQPWYKHVYNGANAGVNVACLVTHSCPF